MPIYARGCPAGDQRAPPILTTSRRLERCRAAAAHGVHADEQPLPAAFTPPAPGPVDHTISVAGTCAEMTAGHVRLRLKRTACLRRSAAHDRPTTRTSRLLVCCVSLLLDQTHKSSASSSFCWCSSAASGARTATCPSWCTCIVASVFAHACSKALV